MSKTDELIKIAQQQNKDADKLVGVQSDDVDEAAKFISAMGLKNGCAICPVRSMWEFYKRWAIKPISKKAFGNQFTTYFPQYRKNSYRYYKLNLRPWDIHCKLLSLNEKIHGNEKK